MYLDHFGLYVNPFSLSPKLEFLYKSGAFEESIAHLLYGIDNCEAIVMITGAIGTGKTMALQSFMANLNQGFQWALVTNTQVTPLELLKLILEDLGIDFPLGVDKSDLLILFKEFLVTSSRNGQKVIVIIDEAQNMAREVLEEVRLLTNLGQGNVQPVQVILVGQPELEVLVNRPDLAQLRQRIRVHYRLDLLSRKEVAGYLNHRMKVAGCQDHVFESGAIDRISDYSGGVPRLVNSLAGQALLSAFVAGRKQVTSLDVTTLEKTPEYPNTRIPATTEPTLNPAGVDPDPLRNTIENQGLRRRTKGRKRTFPLVLGLVGVLLLMVVLVVFLRSGLQPIIGNITSPKPSDLAMFGQTDSFYTESVVSTTPVVATQKVAPVDSVSLSEARPKSLGQYFVQVASFKTMDRAKRCCRELEAEGFGTKIKEQRILDILWQRVLIGPYVDRESALNGLSQYKHPEGENYFPISVIEPDSGN